MKEKGKKKEKKNEEQQQEEKKKKTIAVILVRARGGDAGHGAGDPGGGFDDFVGISGSGTIGGDGSGSNGYSISRYDYSIGNRRLVTTSYSDARMNIRIKC